MRQTALMLAAMIGFFCCILGLLDVCAQQLSGALPADGLAPARAAITLEAPHRMRGWSHTPTPLP